MQRVQLLIDGASVEAASGHTFDRLDPMSGAVATRAAAASEVDALAAACAAERAFERWAPLGPSERRARLLRAADVLESRAADFAASMRAEIGSTAGWAGFNVDLAARMLREAGA